MRCTTALTKKGLGEEEGALYNQRTQGRRLRMERIEIDERRKLRGKQERRELRRRKSTQLTLALTRESKRRDTEKISGATFGLEKDS